VLSGSGLRYALKSLQTSVAVELLPWSKHCPNGWQKYIRNWRNCIIDNYCCLHLSCILPSCPVTTGCALRGYATCWNAGGSWRAGRWFHCIVPLLTLLMLSYWYGIIDKLHFDCCCSELLPDHWKPKVTHSCALRGYWEKLLWFFVLAIVSCTKAHSVVGVKSPGALSHIYICCWSYWQWYHQSILINAVELLPSLESPQTWLCLGGCWKLCWGCSCCFVLHKHSIYVVKCCVLLYCPTFPLLSYYVTVFVFGNSSLIITLHSILSNTSSETVLHSGSLGKTLKILGQSYLKYNIAWWMFFLPFCIPRHPALAIYLPKFLRICGWGISSAF
jgi:hypothetical protein